MKQIKPARIYGQSLFEVVISLSIIALVLTAVIGLSTQSIRSSSFSRDNAQAVLYSREGLEWLRRERDTNWTAFYGRANVSGRTYCLNSLNWSSSGSCSGSSRLPNTIFRREVELRQVNRADPPLGNESIQAIVILRWEDATGSHSMQNETVFTPWQ